jgi:GDP/UDP-N,N'-diacetylbacillosamine 2-epimerase (hydrolysing)
MKTIAVVTSSRSDYSPLSKILLALSNEKKCKLKLYVTGSHLLPSYGLTKNEILKDGIKIIKCVKLGDLNKSPSSVGLSVSKGIKEFIKIFSKDKPDVLLILGDRFEILSSAIASFFMHIPIAHIAGGHVTTGSIDDSIRHMITKVSSLHFTSNKIYAERLKNMGENPKNIYVVGSTALEELKNFKFLSKFELEEQLKIKIKRKIFIITFHPETSEADLGIKKLKNLINFIPNVLEKDVTIIITGSNLDEKGFLINKKLKKFSKKYKEIHFFNSLGKKNYFSLLKIAYAVIGNSSSGVIEVPSFKIPSINIGLRQNGRIKQKSIIDCDGNKKSLKISFSKINDKKFRDSIKKQKNIFYKSNSSSLIKDILLKKDLLNILPKNFYYKVI